MIKTAVQEKLVALSKTRVAALTAVLLSYTDGSTVQINVVANFSNRRETTDREIELELIAALYDGIARNIWPWTERKPGC